MVGQAVMNQCSPPRIPDQTGLGCCGTGTCAFIGVQGTVYWSSTTLDVHPAYAWGAHVANGTVPNILKTYETLVWPVRD